MVANPENWHGLGEGEGVAGATGEAEVERVAVTAVEGVAVTAPCRESAIAQRRVCTAGERGGGVMMMVASQGRGRKRTAAVLRPGPRA